MEQRRLGQSGLEVPVVGMGTWETFDVVAPADVQQRKTVVEAALSAGSSLFDTAAVY